MLKLFIKKSMGFRLNQLDTLSELSLNEDILRAFGESSLAEARPEAREPIQRRGVRSPARLDVRQSHMLFLQPDCDTVVAPLADFRSADGADLPCGPLALRHAPLASGQCWRHSLICFASALLRLHCAVSTAKISERINDSIAVWLQEEHVRLPHVPARGAAHATGCSCRGYCDASPRR